MRYSVDEARRIVGDAGYIGRVSASGKLLCIYDGDAEQPGTWMEFARLTITNGTVSGEALNFELD